MSPSDIYSIVFGDNFGEEKTVYPKTARDHEFYLVKRVWALTISYKHTDR